MAANNDNAMTRFLFAILKQKCLKDVRIAFPVLPSLRLDVC